MSGAEAVSSALPETVLDDNYEGSGTRRRIPAHATFSDDVVPPLPSIGRRNSSFPSARRGSSADGSRRSVQSSTDSLFVPRPTEEHDDHEPSLWYSTPLLFAILPAIGGVVFKKGSVFLTDLVLLGLAALYLNWCLVTPWIWYHSAQSVKVIEFTEQDPTLGPVDDALGDDIASEPSTKHADDSSAPKKPFRPDKQARSNDAIKELRLHELTALALCFLGPLLGSYILHLIRGQLSTIGDQLVSNLHLTLFVLGAEIRPLRHAMKMAQARTLFLQRVVREDPHAESEDAQITIKDLSKRLDELETSFADKVAAIHEPSANPRAAEGEETMKKLQASMQTQIDALNRAVRRYEKRAATQTMQTEARLQDLDTRLKEAVSLAAAAANYSQRPGLILLVLGWLRSAVSAPIKAVWLTSIYPLQLARSFVIKIALRLGVVQVTEGTAKGTRTSGNPKSIQENLSRKSRKQLAKN